ncbi:MAG: hypothetical protein ACPLIG_05040 [Candidatus Bathyarchaeales archaeon]
METLTVKALADPAVLLEGFRRDCHLRGMTEESTRRYLSSLRIYAAFFWRSEV